MSASAVVFAAEETNSIINATCTPENKLIRQLEAIGSVLKVHGLEIVGVNVD